MVTDVLISQNRLGGSVGSQVWEKSHLAMYFSRNCPDDHGAALAPATSGDAVMKAIFTGSLAAPGPAHVAPALGLLFALSTAGSALAAQGTPEQRRACTPDVYRLCPGEIPNVRAITACLRRQKASLSEACRALFEQWEIWGRAAVTTARMLWRRSIAETGAAGSVTIDANNQIGVAQMTDQIAVVMQSTGRNCVNVANLARHPGWAPENDTALRVE
jgi:hypothetical protein